MFESRRKFLRFGFVSDVEFQSNGSSFTCRTKNVSRDGISFVSQACNLNVGTPLQFQMQHPQMKTKIKALADIAWKKQVGDECHLGLHFNDINKTDKSDILDLAYDNWLEAIRKSQ